MRLLRSALLVWLSMASMAWANNDGPEPSAGNQMGFIAVTPPQSIAPVRLLRGKAQEIDLSDFRGKLILLNLWATWCSPCLRELPALDRLQQRLGSEHFEVVAVALDRRGYDGVREFFDKLKIKHLSIYHGSTDAFAEEFPVDLFPASFLIDPQGRVLSFLRSYADWDAPEAHAMIQQHLQAP
ncbi:MAG: thiol-disulfide isomerase/thioredoxin [Motiliproteus sp.]|jgi:thiol-disulfide isomerase/thioredoxin